jgi:hypothetical protein
METPVIVEIRICFSGFRFFLIEFKTGVASCGPTAIIIKSLSSTAFEL